MSEPEAQQMPLWRFILLLAVVFLAAALSIGVAFWAAAALELPAFAFTAAAPALLLAVVTWRLFTLPKS
ncbi:MAG: hypothetical protein OIF40_03250 [Mangrovicoccus sp.]|nr:hypothetical protein [Mangrovicoccus sp.]